MGCLKVIYKRKKRHFILWHRNATDTRISLDEVEKVSYHRQKDMESAESIMEYLQYIQKHDKYKPSMNTDYRKLPRDTKRQKVYYNAAKKREKKRSAKRVERLFSLIEQQEGIRHLSFC